MANAYFTLTDSVNTRSKKFAVILSGYTPVKRKSGGIQIDIDGGLDVSVGSIQQIHEYLIKVRDVEDRDGYGNKDDLDYFHSLNTPNGTPSNVLLLTDHFGVDHYAVFPGDFSPQPLGVVIEGLNAYFVVRCTFYFLPISSLGSGS
jgi:hypothetical protein